MTSLTSLYRAFSSKVVATLRDENALNQKSGARLRYKVIEHCSGPSQFLSLEER